MPEHYTKNTVEASIWCNKCGGNTPHRIDDGRRGPCLPCLVKLNAQDFTKPEPAAEQAELFAGEKR